MHESSPFLRPGPRAETFILVVLLLFLFLVLIAFMKLVGNTAADLGGWVDGWVCVG